MPREAGTSGQEKTAKLTARTIAALAPGEWANAPAARGAGVLQARKLASGDVVYYLRVTTRPGHRERVTLGTGISFDQAKQAAAALSLRYQKGDRDLRASLKTDRLEREREREAKAAAAQAAKDHETAKRMRTLGALLDAYADQLARDGKPSARSVQVALHRNVRDAFPKLWAEPLADIDADSLLAIVAKPAEAGHLRQAEKLRAYLRAAFAAGVKARHNAKALPALRALRVTANPARDLTPIEGANKARDRALSLAELRAYWQRIQTPELAPLRFHLLTGCQRIAQLARARLADFDADTQSLRLLDGKGRRTTARQHHVPIIAGALDAMRAMQGGGPFACTVTGGKTGAGYAAIADRLHAVADAMLQAGELPGGAFTPGDLRRTVETRLADVGVSRDARAFLQSHGLGGVQTRHYDRHDTLPETRAALETLHNLLADASASIVAFKRKA